MMLDLSAASKAFGVAHKAMQAYYAELKARRAAEFEAAGGCKQHFTATSNVQVIALAPWEKDLAPCSCPPEDHFGWTPQRDCPEHGEK